MKIRLFLKQLFCRHKYELVNKDEVFPNPPAGGGISFTRPHICSKCKKETLLNSGWIF